MSDRAYLGTLPCRARFPLHREAASQAVGIPTETPAPPPTPLPRAGEGLHAFKVFGIHTNWKRAVGALSKARMLVVSQPFAPWKALLQPRFAIFPMHMRRATTPSTL
jgi:hypothetical protein